VRDLFCDALVRNLSARGEQESLVGLGIGNEDRLRENAPAHHQRTFAVMWMSGTYRTGIATAAPFVHT
jgi:hypothetical protein